MGRSGDCAPLVERDLAGASSVYFDSRSDSIYFGNCAGSFGGFLGFAVELLAQFAPEEQFIVARLDEQVQQNVDGFILADAEAVGNITEALMSAPGDSDAGTGRFFRSH